MAAFASLLISWVQEWCFSEIVVCFPIYEITKMGYFKRSTVAKVSLQHCNCCVNGVNWISCYLRYVKPVYAVNNAGFKILKCAKSIRC